jgi:LDH2 family malate/lactate/ureidoglycolate dehydrogenase
MTQIRTPELTGAAEDIIRLSSDATRKLIFSALTGVGTSPENAAYFTEAILDTELSGLAAKFAAAGRV